jgi:ABC-type Fe3+/spermidine/putrescine transport system ATPase subunit
MISGFEEPSSGEILLDGKSVVGIPPYERDTSMVFQNYALFPHRNVEQNIGFGLRMRGEKRGVIASKVRSMLSLLGLEGLGKRRISELSGGQQQRVALGRALVVEPAVLLLDEPLGSLDLKLRKQMQVELKRIQKQLGTTFVYVTHDQEEALVMSDRIAVMNAGQVEQFDTSAAIYRRLASEFVADFIGEANILSGEVTAHQDGIIEVQVAGVTTPIRAPLAGAQPPARGSQISLVIRPEKISLGGTPDPDTNVLKGTIRDIMFTGPTLKLVLNLANGTSLAVHTQEEVSLSAPGQELTVSWPVQDTVLVGIK